MPKKAEERKRKKPKTGDLRETQKMDVRDTIYNVYAKKISKKRCFKATSCFAYWAEFIVSISEMFEILLEKGLQ